MFFCLENFNFLFSFNWLKYPFAPPRLSECRVVERTQERGRGEEEQEELSFNWIYFEKRILCLCGVVRGGLTDYKKCGIWSVNAKEEPVVNWGGGGDEGEMPESSPDPIDFRLKGFSGSNQRFCVLSCQGRQQSPEGVCVAWMVDWTRGTRRSRRSV